jgi:hypothetical protein
MQIHRDEDTDEKNDYYKEFGYSDVEEGSSGDRIYRRGRKIRKRSKTNKRRKTSKRRKNKHDKK